MGYQSLQRIAVGMIMAFSSIQTLRLDQSMCCVFQTSSLIFHGTGDCRHCRRYVFVHGERWFLTLTLTVAKGLVILLQWGPMYSIGRGSLHDLNFSTMLFTQALPTVKITTGLHQEVGTGTLRIRHSRSSWSLGSYGQPSAYSWAWQWDLCISLSQVKSCLYVLYEIKWIRFIGYSTMMYDAYFDLGIKEDLERGLW